MSASFPDEQSRQLDEEGIPDLETPVNVDEGMIPPRDHPQGVDEYGITPAEERLDEPLAQRVLREEPDFDESAMAQAADEAIGSRIVEPGSFDVDELDDEKDAVATLVDDDGIGQTAEEAAMHTTDTP